MIPTTEAVSSDHLKIICLEEHILDPALLKSSAPGTVSRFPYMNLHPGEGFIDTPEASSERRPLLRALSKTVPYLLGSIEDRLQAMDAHGIDMQVLSYSNFTQFSESGQAAALAHAANEHLADVTSRYPNRFSGFATLPWHDPDAATRELEYATEELRLPAAMLSGYPADGVFLDDDRYDVLLGRLAELGAPVYIHPGPPVPVVQQAYYAGFQSEVTMRLSLAAWGWHHEAGLQVVRLILSGAFDRHPALKIISGHWGEMVPFFLNRLDDILPRELTGLSRTLTQTYRDHVYVTPSGMLHAPHFEFIRNVLGSERIMYSVDYPYLTLTGARDWLEELPLREDEKAAIAHGNAEMLLNLPRS